MEEKEIIEKLAELEHTQWAHWTEYMLKRLETLERDEDASDPYKVRREKGHWRKQIKTPYSKLTEKEKEADRKWARKVLALLHSINAVISSGVS